MCSDNSFLNCPDAVLEKRDFGQGYVVPSHSFAEKFGTTFEGVKLSSELG